MIRDIKITLNTAGSNFAEEVTPLINGALKALIIKSEFPMKITVRMKDSDIPLFEAHNYTGNDYLDLKTDSYSPAMQRVNYNNSHFYLNDELLVRIEGSKNKEVEIVLRYSSEDAPVVNVNIPSQIIPPPTEPPAQEVSNNG